MRSSNKRSRSKSNRNRPSGNIVNRVFDSSGPEGKVRGTPQQIIDKYNQLARDAQLSNDRVAAENFQQHAEHYLRMLADAQREMDARREQQEQQAQQKREQRRDPPDGESQGQKPQVQQPVAEQPQPVEPAPVAEMPSDVIDTGEGGDSGLVETPESKPAPRRRSRRKPKADAADKGESPAEPQPSGDAQEAAE